MTPQKSLPTHFRRTGLGDLGLMTFAASVIAGLGWWMWSAAKIDRDLERRWAIPHEAKQLAAEELALTPVSTAELAGAEMKAATTRYESAIAAAHIEQLSHRAAGRLSEVEAQSRWKETSESLRNCHRMEMDAARENAERLAKQLETHTAQRRVELRREALELLAEWEALYARHPEWPPQRLTPAE